MANTFKNASLVDVGTDDVLYTAPAGTTTVILGVALANKNSYNINATVKFNDSSAGTSVSLVPGIVIPGNNTLEMLAGQKYILEPGDSLTCTSETESSLDVTLGIMEIS
jgi:hypothetical protein